MELPDFLKGKFKTDVLWNVSSLAILGISGVIINGVIGRFLGYEALGVFNQVFAVYIFLSQISVGGIHLSVLKHVSHAQDNMEKCTEIVTPAIVLALILGIIVSGIAYLLRHWVGAVLESSAVVVGLGLAIPGLLFYSLNKVLLNVLNAVRSMRAYAIFQSVRFILILIAVIVIIIIQLPSTHLGLSFALAEGLLFVALIIYVNSRVFRLRFSGTFPHWVREHLSFGFRGFLSGVFSEINTKVDVLMLGFFLSDAVVGLYSFAAILAEGFGQLTTVFRRNVDPVLGHYLATGRTAELEEFSRKMVITVFKIVGTLGILGVAAYPLILIALVGSNQLRTSWLVFATLVAGIVLSSGIRAFNGILLQGGHPGYHTLLIAIIVLSNVVLNAIFIPLWGTLGAATATALVYQLQAFLLLVAAKKLLDIRLLSLCGK